MFLSYNSSGPYILCLTSVNLLTCNVLLYSNLILQQIFNSSLAPICLPEKNEDFLGKFGWAAGWGALNPGSRLRPKTLQAVDVPVIENRVCERWHRANGINVVIYPEMLCAGYRNGIRINDESWRKNQSWFDSLLIARFFSLNCFFPPFLSFMLSFDVVSRVSCPLKFMTRKLDWIDFLFMFCSLQWAWFMSIKYQFQSDWATLRCYSNVIQKMYRLFH